MNVKFWLNIQIHTMQYYHITYYTYLVLQDYLQDYYSVLRY